MADDQPGSLTNANPGGELWRSVMRTAVDPILVIDQHGAIQHANDACTALFGHKVDDLIGRNVMMLMPEPYHSAHDGYLGRYMETGEARIIGIGRDVVGKRADGTTFPMALAVSEVQTDEGQRLFTGIIHDLTERAEAEVQLSAARDHLEETVHKRTAELEASLTELAQSKERLNLLSDRERIARDLHDTVIQQLFATGLGLQALAPLIADTAVRSRLQEGVEGIDDGIRQLREAIFDLKITAKGHSLTDEVMEIVESEAAALGFGPTVRLAIPPHVDLAPRVRSGLLSTLREALSNAARHAQATAVTVDVEIGGDDVSVTVSDDGIGIDEEHNTRRRSSGASGHGLRNLRDRASDLNGSCEIARGETGGTVIRWNVPRDAK